VASDPQFAVRRGCKSGWMDMARWFVVEPYHQAVPILQGKPSF
jgi:hypothetical protein